MTKANIRVGIVWRNAIDSSWLRLFYSFGYPEWIEPGKATTKFDVVIIPDGGSAYVGMDCFKPNMYKAIGLKPMDIAIEMFRTEPRGLEYYLKHGVPIVGIGEGAVMLWDKMGNKCSLRGEGENTKIEFIKHGCNGRVIKSNDIHVTEFEHENMWGVESLYSPLLRNILTDIQSEVTKQMEAKKDISQRLPFILGSFG